MKEKQLVTLEELEDLYKKSPRSQQNTTLSISSNSALERHLLAERLFQQDYHEVNWLELIKSPESLFAYAEAWIRPLFWQDPSTFKNLLIDGNVAEEEFYNNRYLEVSELVDYIYEQLVLAFADKPAVFEENYFELGIVKGKHNWAPLTWDVKSFIDELLVGDEIDDEDLNKKYYNFIRLRYNLTTIAEQRSGKRAAELLHALQNEWPTIKQMKTGTRQMADNDIADFEDNLFHGFDDILPEWEKDNNQPTNTATPDSSFFIVADDITYKKCEEVLIDTINYAKSKASACRKLTSSANAKYFDLSDKTDDEKAAAINPWVARTNKNYVFTADDFRKARNG